MATDLVSQLLSSTLSVSAAVLMIALLRQPLRRRLGARVAYGVWAALPLVLLASLLPGPSIDNVVLIAPQGFGTVPSISAAIQGAAGSDSSMLWLSLWALGAVALLLLLISTQLRFQRQLGALQADARGCWRSAGIAAPALLGLWRSRIVLPRDFEQRYDAREQALVIAHEQAHRRHGDPWANLIASLIGCLLWFNPLLWWALSRFRFDQELACDARVLESEPEARRDYAAALLKSQLDDDAGWRLPLGCHWQSSHPLKERIAMLKHPLPKGLRRRAGVLLATALCAAASLASWAAQPGQTADYAGKALLDLRFAIALDGGKPMTPSVRVHDGEPFELRIDEGGVEIIGRFTVSLQSNDQMHLRSELLRNGKSIGKPELVFIAAQGARIEIAEKPGEMFALDVTGEVIEAGASTSTALPLADGSKSDPRVLTSLQTEDKVAPPKYPKSALDQGIGGEVMLKVQVLPDGSVGEVLVESAVPAGVFEKVALEAARTWKFNPQRRNGNPVVGWVLVPVKFSPDDGLAEDNS